MPNERIRARDASAHIEGDLNMLLADKTLVEHRCTFSAATEIVEALGNKVVTAEFTAVLPLRPNTVRTEPNVPQLRFLKYPI